MVKQSERGRSRILDEAANGPPASGGSSEVPEGMNGDERCPEGMNYLDWLMNVLPPTEVTVQNLEDIVTDIRRRRESVESGVAPKKHESNVRVDRLMAKLLKAKPKFGRRGF
jgi:hypothetical protein